MVRATHRRGPMLGRAAIVVLASAPAARAVDHDWTNSAGGFFDQTTNWDPAVVPGTGDRGIFNLNGAYTVGFLFDRTAARILVARDNVTFDLNNVDLVLNNAGTGAGSASLVVGQAGPLGGSGRLTIGEGTITAVGGAIGTGAGTLVVGGAGSVTVTTGGALRFGNSLDVGFARAGNVIVNGGGDLFTVNATVGLDAAGSVSLAGGTTSWNASSWIVVGGRAAGTMNVTGGAVVAQSGAGAQGVVGDQSTGSGVVNVDGAGSRWTVGAELFLGNAGDATVNLSNGALLNTPTDTFVANLATSAANVTLGGGDAALVTRSLVFGAGAGTVTINAGGRVQTTTTGTVSVSSTGRINLAGGLLQTGSIQLASPSRLNWTSGTLHINTGSLIIHSTGQLGADVSIGAGKRLFVPELYVAGGSLSITGGGSVENSRAVVGENFAANGTVLVSGAGSSWDVNDLVLGNFGNATLTISNGGAVVNNSLSTGGIELAAASISTSRVTVDGVGSTWDASSIPTGQGFVRVGSRGTGVLQITNGGRVTNDFTHGQIGSETGSNGTVLVDGPGSAWDIGYFLFVGAMGHGSLTITGGGTVSADGAFVGYAIPGLGSLALGGAGSRLDVATFNLAHAGQATVTIGAGATIQATSTMMTEQPSTSALVHVNGGALSSSLSTTMNPNARVQFDAGTFQTGLLQMTGNARVTLSPGRNKIVETTGLSVDAAGGSRIDLADNFLVVDYDGGSPIDGVRSLILAGYNGGAWDGNGISSSSGNPSSLGIGYADASEVFASFPATFAGRTVDASTVLVRFTRYGDANLDGNVNLADFNRLAASFGSTAARWDDGDFNYDGVVNLADFNRLASNFGLSAAGPGAPTPQEWSALAALVPEPVALHVLGTLPLFARRRRHRRKFLPD